MLLKHTTVLRNYFQKYLYKDSNMWLNQNISLTILGPDSLTIVTNDNFLNTKSNIIQKILILQQEVLKIPANFIYNIDDMV